VLELLQGIAILLVRDVGSVRFVTVSFLVYDDDEAIGSANAHTKCTMMIKTEL